jgi:hypothetical protein
MSSSSARALALSAKLFQRFRPPVLGVEVAAPKSVKSDGKDFTSSPPRRESRPRGVQPWMRQAPDGCE